MIKSYVFNFVKIVLSYNSTIKSYAKLLYAKFNKVGLNKIDLQLSDIFLEFTKYTGLAEGKLNTNNINEQSLNTNSYDNEIEKTITKYYKRNKKAFSKYQTTNSNKINVAVAFTELYSTGGHTPLVERMIRSFNDDYNLSVYATRTFHTTHGCYKDKKDDLFGKIKLDGVNWNFSSDKISDLAKNLFNKIVDKDINILFCYIHPHDIVLSSALSLLKNYSKTKIVIINIQDHFYSLGFKFAHLIIDARPAGQKITKEVRGYKNTIIIPLQQKPKDETLYYSKKEISKLRSTLGIKDGEYFTLTGAADYKLFEENHSQYFSFIKELLISEPRLKHVVMTTFSVPLSNEIFTEIFSDSKELLDRLLIIPRVSEFDIYMQACDLFIDSFPQGGALIHIDMMRNKKPTIVKKNLDNAIRSFEYYLPDSYPYIYTETDEMKKGILSLLHSSEDIKKISDALYSHYLSKYEFHVVKSKYKELIENFNQLERFYEN